MPTFKINTPLVHRLLAEQCLTQREAGFQAGLGHSHLNKLLRGVQTPRPSTRRKLLASPVFAGLSHGELFSEVQEAGGAD